MFLRQKGSNALTLTKISMAREFELKFFQKYATLETAGI